MNKWITTPEKPDRLICGNCGYEEDMWWADKGTKYCPGCGKDMFLPELNHMTNKPIISNIDNIRYVGRPCLVNGEPALFRQFVETEQLILIPDKLPLKHQPLNHCTIEDHIIITNKCSVEKIKNVAAIVEFKDGDVAMVDVESIQFLDTGDLLHENDIFFRKKEEL